MNTRLFLCSLVLVLGLGLLPGCAPTRQPVPTPPSPSSQTAPPSQKAATPKPILRLDTGGHTSIVWDLVVSRDRNYLISCADDKTIRLWDPRTRREKGKILGQIGEGPFGMIYAIALSPDGRYLAVGGYLDEDRDYR